MNNKELVIKLVDLQVDLVKYVEKHTNLKCKTHRDFDRVITSNKLTCTYSLAVKNLYNNAVKFIPGYAFNAELLDEIVKLKNEVENSELKGLRFGLEPQHKFSEEERELDTLMLQHKLNYFSRWNDK